MAWLCHVCRNAMDYPIKTTISSRGTCEKCGELRACYDC